MQQKPQQEGHFLKYYMLYPMAFPPGPSKTQVSAIDFDSGEIKDS